MLDLICYSSSFAFGLFLSLNWVRVSLSSTSKIYCKQFFSNCTVSAACKAFFSMEWSGVASVLFLLTTTPVRFKFAFIWLVFFSGDLCYTDYSC